MKKLILILCAGWFLTSCSSNNEPEPAQPPAKATLIAPVKDEACTTGTNLTGTQSTVTLSWSAAAHADSYEVTVKNLLTNQSQTQTVAATSLQVPLSVSTPYSWFVISKSSLHSSTEQSETWKFHNSGPGVTSYAPFPAEIVTPTFGQIIPALTSDVILNWNGSDVDNDIVNYDVYLGTTATPALFKSNLTESRVSGMSLSANTTYYWKVITRDSKGNTSDSGIYQFKVSL